MTCGDSHLGFPIGIKNRGPSNDHSWAIWFHKAKLYMNVHWMILYKFYVFCSNMKFKMAATAELSLTLDPMGKCSNAFFSETTNIIKAKLYMNVHWMVPYKL
jgi:hypothetical protein